MVKLFQTKLEKKKSKQEEDFPDLSPQSREQPAVSNLRVLQH